MAIISKEKMETLQAFKLFHLFVKTQFHTTIKAVRSDYGVEYRSFINYVTELSINQILTYPYTYHQNGIVERKHTHIIEVGLTLLAHTSIPITFSDHIFSTSAYLINRLLFSSLPNSTHPFMHYMRKNPITNL